MWSKSSYSGATSCVEWRKSSYSYVSACIEAGAEERAIQIRDSANTAGPVLAFSPAKWREFICAVRTGQVPLVP
jgi:uncharacterized protein DUF397